MSQNQDHADSQEQQTNQNQTSLTFDINFQTQKVFLSSPAEGEGTIVHFRNAVTGASIAPKITAASMTGPKAQAASTTNPKIRMPAATPPAAESQASTTKQSVDHHPTSIPQKTSSWSKLFFSSPKQNINKQSENSSLSTIKREGNHQRSTKDSSIPQRVSELSSAATVNTSSSSKRTVNASKIQSAKMDSNIGADGSTGVDSDRGHRLVKESSAKNVRKTDQHAVNPKEGQPSMLASSQRVNKPSTQYITASGRQNEKQSSSHRVSSSNIDPAILAASSSLMYASQRLDKPMNDIGVSSSMRNDEQEANKSGLHATYASGRRRVEKSAASGAVGSFGRQSEKQSINQRIATTNSPSVSATSSRSANVYGREPAMGLSQQSSYASGSSQSVLQSPLRYQASAAGPTAAYHPKTMASTSGAQAVAASRASAQQVIIQSSDLAQVILLAGPAIRGGGNWDPDKDVGDGNWVSPRFMTKIGDDMFEKYQKAYNFVQAFERANARVFGFIRQGRVGDEWRWDDLLEAIPQQDRGTITKKNSLRVRWVQDRQFMNKMVDLQNDLVDEENERGLAAGRTPETPFLSVRDGDGDDDGEEAEDVEDEENDEEEETEYEEHETDEEWDFESASDVSEEYEEGGKCAKRAKRG